MVLMVHGGMGFSIGSHILRCLEGHWYSVCPLCIPALSLNQDGTNDGVGGVVGGGEEDDNDENDLMTSLGMLRDKNGEFESFDKFLHRTEVSPKDESG